MVEYHKISVNNSISGIKETEGCIFKKLRGCEICDIKCHFSGTEIVAPKLCPLRNGDINIIVSLKKHYMEEW